MDKVIGGRRVVWNPLARYYVEPFGEFLAGILAKTPITPNMVTLFNIISSAAAGWILLSAHTPAALIIFAILVQWFHALDVADGMLSKLTSMKSNFGGWIDRAGDRIVVNIWAIAIGVSLFQTSGNPAILYLTLSYIFGKYLYHFLSLTSDIYYPGHSETDMVKDNLKKNPLVWMFLFFLDYDIQLHILSISAAAQRLDIFLAFYAVYFNLVWVGYIAYYGYKHARGID
ncbi:CDP-alcohol phosphatidyltransferase family protein [Candidatus Woesearchaeota archaeon]|nr:CDP-alcohol phosphatidyltransferase family protein [Candidatus Woesearchaeota archaeon]